MNEPGKIMLLFLVAIMFTVQAVAQNLSVSGLVQDGTTGEGVIGANVVVKGTTNGPLPIWMGSLNYRPSKETSLSFPSSDIRHRNYRPQHK